MGHLITVATLVITSLTQCFQANNMLVAGMRFTELRGFALGIS